MKMRGMGRKRRVEEEDRNGKKYKEEKGRTEQQQKSRRGMNGRVKGEDREDG